MHLFSKAEVRAPRSATYRHQPLCRFYVRFSLPTRGLGEKRIIIDYTSQSTAHCCCTHPASLCTIRWVTKHLCRARLSVVGGATAIHHKRASNSWRRLNVSSAAKDQKAMSKGMNGTLAWLPQAIISEVSFETGGCASCRVGLNKASSLRRETLQSNYPCGNFSDTSGCILLRPKGWIGHAFTVCIRTEKENHASFSPFGPHEISVLVELT